MTTRCDFGTLQQNCRNVCRNHLKVCFRAIPFRPLMHLGFPSWGPGAAELSEVASLQKGSLSELLLRAGYFQIGRPDTGSFDAICFDMNDRNQNREHGIVLANHEEILCNLRVEIRSQVWPSFRKFLETVVKS
jgi:hypothetical protein